MPQRQAIENAPILLPLPHVRIQQCDEPGVVMSLQQVCQFVDDDVLKAPHRLLSQLGVEADRPGRGVAAAPPGLHALDKDPLHPYPEDAFPLCEQPEGGLLELLPVP